MVNFIEMTDDEFQRWKDRAIVEYFSERVKAGNEDLGPEASRREFESLLPQGRRTKNHHVYFIADENEKDRKVGIVWYATEAENQPKGTIFIYDIEVEEGLRGRGYGRATLGLLEDRAKEMGVRRIALHVFGHNVRARKLYEDSGYRATNVIMAKELSPAHGAGSGI